MKKLKVWLGIGLLTAGTALAGEISDADKQWCKAVESKISQGAATISTPSESRAKLAKELADKHGRKCEVKKTDTGYRVVVGAATAAAQTAAK